MKKNNYEKPCVDEHQLLASSMYMASVEGPGGGGASGGGGGGLAPLKRPGEPFPTHK